MRPLGSEFDSPYAIEGPLSRTWTINGRFLTQPVTGVQRYARELVGALDVLAAEPHPLTRGLNIELAVPPGGEERPALQTIGVRTVGRWRGHIWEQLELPHAGRGGLLSLCNTGPVAARRHIICIHDVNTRTHPESYSARFRAVYRGLLPALARAARVVTTVSKSSAAELARLGIARSEKIRVIPCGHEHALSWVPVRSARMTGDRHTILVLGSPAPHKNVSMLARLAARLEAAGLKLAVAGLADGRVFQKRGLVAKSASIIWLGRITDGELAGLLDDCLCLALPSLAEGFGLPALEAMARGCPVVVSDRASLPEICGNAAVYASPIDPDAWLASFLRLRGDPRLRADLIKRGRLQARRFSWRASALLYVEAMAWADGIGPVRGDGPPHDIPLSRIAPVGRREDSSMGDGPDEDYDPRGT